MHNTWIAAAGLESVMKALAEWRLHYGCEPGFNGTPDAVLAHAFDAWKEKVEAPRVKCPTCRCMLRPGEECMCCAEPDIDDDVLQENGF